MSTQPQGNIPELTLGWRMQMALGDMKVQDIADTLGVNRATVGRWMHDKGAPPKRAYLLQWALATGVDRQWLETGETPAGPEPDGGLDVERARRDSNSQPSDPKVRGSVTRLAPRSGCEAA